MQENNHNQPWQIKETQEANEEDQYSQYLFTSISTTVYLWLEQNIGRHNPEQGQLQIAKITEATMTVTQHLRLRYLRCWFIYIRLLTQNFATNFIF